MAICPNLAHLKLDQQSLDALERIYETPRNITVLISLLGMSPLVSILRQRGASAAATAKNISEYDWKLWADALQAATELEQATIYRIARDEWARTLTGDQAIFWQAMAEGCEK